MNNILVIGSGMVGSAMALDMSEQHKVTCADIDEVALNALKKRNENIQVESIDVTNFDELSKLLKPFDLVINAVPGFLGYRTLENILLAKKDVVDISFFPEDGLKLNDLAKEKGVTAIIDCGVAPGMDNLILGRYNQQLQIDSFECLVGGLPVQKKWPFYYKAPFSPKDVIEEYTRPARYVEHSNIIEKPALSDCTLHEFDGIGTLESFNSDGLRSIIYTMSHIPNMKEKTLRYPGHAEYIQVLKESGFFDTKPVIYGNSQITPLDFTSNILFKEWKLEDREDEFTVMRITIKGLDSEGKNVSVQYDLFDRNDEKTEISSMARSTGYTATAAANMILEGKFSTKGVFPPEIIGGNKACFDFILGYLEERGVVYNKSISNVQ